MVPGHATTTQRMRRSPAYSRQAMVAKPSPDRCCCIQQVTRPRVSAGCRRGDCGSSRRFGQEEEWTAPEDGDHRCPPRRDAVPDDARDGSLFAESPYGARARATDRHSGIVWTRHDAGGRRADHGRKVTTRPLLFLGRDLAFGLLRCVDQVRGVTGEGDLDCDERVVSLGGGGLQVA